MTAARPGHGDRHEEEGLREALADLAASLDSIADDPDVQRLSAPNAYRSAAGHIRRALAARPLPAVTDQATHTEKGER